MKPQKTQILTLLIITLFSCSTDPILYEHDSDALYYVYCTLNPMSENQEVLLGKTFPETRPIDVTDASITISSATDTGRFVYIRDGIYKDLMDPLEITKGETYTLQVNIPNGRVFTGKTTVPGDFHIQSFVPGDTLDYYAIFPPDTLDFPGVRWTQSQSAYFYTISLDCGEYFYPHGSQLYRTSTFLPELFFCDSIPLDENEIISATLYIAAHDSSQALGPHYRYFKNYNDNLSYEELMIYRQARSDLPSSGNINSVNVTSDLGFFSAISVDSCVIYLRIHKE